MRHLRPGVHSHSSAISFHQALFPRNPLGTRTIRGSGTVATEDACSFSGTCLVLSSIEHTCIHVLHRCSIIRQSIVTEGALSLRGLLDWHVAEQPCIIIKIIDPLSADHHDHHVLTATFSTSRCSWSGWPPRLVLGERYWYYTAATSSLYCLDP